MPNKIISQGAEATISLNKENQILKSRISKSYRLPFLDNKIRKQRTRRESKVLEKTFKIIPVPLLISSSESNYEILMSYIKGKKLSEHLDLLKNKLEIAFQIGKQIALLHDNEIIHGDLTTSNIILSSEDNKIYFIDFGLSFNSSKAEDKAVDLHLISQALEAKHFLHYNSLFSSLLEGYKSSSIEAPKILKRLEKVEKRGRYKQQY